MLGLGLASCVGLPPDAPAQTEGTPATSTTVPATSLSGTSTPGSTTLSTADTTGSDDQSNDVADTGEPNGPDLGIPGECSPYEQDCPRGEKCAAWADDGGDVWNSTRCIPVEGDGQVHDRCSADGETSGVDDCDVAIMCWNLGPMQQGECIGLCTGTLDDPGCSDPDYTCARIVPGVLDLCLPTCDPLLQDCSMDQGCYPAGDDSFVCYRSDPIFGGAFGDPCELTHHCSSGLLCIPPDFVPSCDGDVGCCTSYCDVLGGDLCSMGLQCAALFPEGQAPPELEHVGICIQV